MIGLLGGTFDPIHYGHLRPALEAAEAIGLRQVRLIPLHRAVHRAQPLAPAPLRLAMAAAAVADLPLFVTDAREIERDAPSRTYVTLVSLRAELGADEAFCVLIGGDAFNGFLDWHRPLDILGLAHLVILQRPGAPMPRDPQLRELLQCRRATQIADLNNSPAGRIWLQPVTQLAISSTLIRRLIATGRSARFLMPEAVLSIIDEQRLYRQPDPRAAAQTHP